MTGGALSVSVALEFEWVYGDAGADYMRVWGRSQLAAVHGRQPGPFEVRELEHDHDPGRLSRGADRVPQLCIVPLWSVISRAWALLGSGME